MKAMNLAAAELRRVCYALREAKPKRRYRKAEALRRPLPRATLKGASSIRRLL